MANKTQDATGVSGPSASSSGPLTGVPIVSRPLRLPRIDLLTRLRAPLVCRAQLTAPAALLLLLPRRASPSSRSKPDQPNRRRCQSPPAELAATKLAPLVLLVPLVLEPWDLATMAAMASTTPRLLRFLPSLVVPLMSDMTLACCFALSLQSSAP